MNLSSRVESLTKFYHADVVASQFSVEKMQHWIVTRELDTAIVVGLSTPVKLYQILGRNSDTSPRLLEIKKEYEEARQMYAKREFKKAKETFDHLYEKYGDWPSHVFSERCTNFLEKPPPENWDAVWRFDHK